LAFALESGGRTGARRAALSGDRGGSASAFFRAARALGGVDADLVFRPAGD
jgi:hypothetical protein